MRKLLSPSLMLKLTYQILIFSATKRYIVGFVCKFYNHNNSKNRKKKQHIKQKKQAQYHLTKTKKVTTEAPVIFQVLMIKYRIFLIEPCFFATFAFFDENIDRYES